MLTSKGGEGEGRPKKGAAAKELLARYGSAYLITSISLSLVSFGMFYVLVSSGVDVAALLRQARSPTRWCCRGASVPPPPEPSASNRSHDPDHLLYMVVSLVDGRLLIQRRVC